MYTDVVGNYKEGARRDCATQVGGGQIDATYLGGGGDGGGDGGGGGGLCTHQRTRRVRALMILRYNLVMASQ